MNDFSTYEYVVQKKKKGTGRLLPIVLIVIYALTVILLLAFALISKIGAPLVAFAPLALVLIIFLTWRYTKIEYEYSVTSGIVTFSEIYGGRSRKTVCEFTIKDCTVIAPADNEDKLSRAQAQADSVYSALSGKNGTLEYFALYEDEKGKKRLVLFEMTEKMLKTCRFYNAPALAV